MELHRGASFGLRGYPAPARRAWGVNCGGGYAPPVARSSSSMATRSVLRSPKILATAQTTGGYRRCATPGCVGCWLRRAPMSSARPSRCFTRCSVGTARTSQDYREIYLRVPLDELRRRDSKGIYAAGQRGDAQDIVGVDVPAEFPEAPDLVLDNYGELDIATAVERILVACTEPE